jgi:hypothetical protein
MFRARWATTDDENGQGGHFHLSPTSGSTCRWTAHQAGSAQDHPAVLPASLCPY